MNIMSKYALTLVGAAVIAIAAVTSVASAAEVLSKEQVQALSDVGTKAFGIRWNGPLVGGSEKNVQAVTDGTTTLTTRKGSRTYIVNNRKLTGSPAQLDYAGNDAELQKTGLRSLQAVGANRAEIAEIRVLHQATQTALTDPRRGKVKLDPSKAGAPTLLVTRQIDGIPVVSSRTVLNVDRAGQIAFLELCWPDISADVMDRAQRLRKLATARYVAPRMEGAKVDSVQAVILHSPAVSFYDDVTAALRVIYRPEALTTGKLSVRYLDESGKDVTMPRQIELPREEPVKRTGATR